MAQGVQWYVAARMGGEFGGEWIHQHVCWSPFPVHLELSQHVHRLYSNTKLNVFNNRYRLTHTENKLMVAKRQEGGEG